MGRELAEPPYVMGHTSDEIDRLVEQSHQFRMQSELLLRAAGLAPGMRVLDVGCGPGDLSILAAQLVGAKDSTTSRRSTGNHQHTD